MPHAPKSVLQYLCREMADRPPARLVVPHACDFGIEQAVARTAPATELHSAGTSLFSRAVGFGVNDVPLALRLKPEVTALFPFFAGMASPMEMAACAVFFRTVGAYIRQSEVPRFRRLVDRAVRLQEEHYGRISAQLLRFRQSCYFRFHEADAWEACIPFGYGDAAVLCPPSAVPSADSDMEACFDFGPVPSDLSVDTAVQTLEGLRDRGCRAYFVLRPGSEFPVPDGYGMCFCCETRPGSAWQVFSTDPARVWAGREPFLPETARPYPVLTCMHVLDESTPVEAVPVSARVANHYRLLWDKGASLRRGDLSFLLLADGRVCGALQLVTGKSLIEIVSAAAPPSVRHRCTDRLPLRLACTREFLDAVNERTHWTHEGLCARVMSDTPASGRHGGIMELADAREEKATGRFRLDYRTTSGLPGTLSDGLREWLCNDETADIEPASGK